jgi:excisionase family DNA binding protein
MNFPVNSRHTSKIALSLKEVSELTSVSVAFLRKEIKKGRLSAMKAGSKVLITADSLTEYLSKAESC